MTPLFKFILKILLIISLASQVCFAKPMEIALTIDDLPVHGELPPHLSRTQVIDQIIAVLDKHHLTGVYGFINGSNALDNQDNRTALQHWIDSGHFLANHSYSHLDLDQVNDDIFIKDIKENEPLLNRLMANHNYHYFRYPYLAEGNTAQKRGRVRQFLFSKQYRVAPVTVDFFDYEWNSAYVRCLSINDKKAIDWLQESFIEQARNALTISHELSQMLFARDIKNVLLLHVGIFDALMLDTLLSVYEKQGVKFIALTNALSDKVYAIDPNVVRPRTYTFLNQIRRARGLDNPKIVKELYETLPEEKLNKICR